jgi:hypothetical protein
MDVGLSLPKETSAGGCANLSYEHFDKAAITGALRVEERPRLMLKLYRSYERFSNSSQFFRQNLCRVGTQTASLMLGQPVVRLLQSGIFSFRTCCRDAFAATESKGLWT